MFRYAALGIRVAACMYSYTARIVRSLDEPDVDDCETIFNFIQSLACTASERYNGRFYSDGLIVSMLLIDDESENLIRRKSFTRICSVCAPYSCLYYFKKH